MDIKIRRIEAEDYKGLYELFSMPKAIKGTLQMPYPLLSAWKDRCENMPDNTHFLVAMCDEKIVGSLALTTNDKYPRRKHSGNIGMAVHDDWHNKGIGNELLMKAIDLADNWLNLTRIELTVFADNDIAIAMYQKYGFTKEGVLKNYAFVDGQFEDVISMARLK